MKYNLRLTGTIETLSPVTIVPPNTEEMTRAGGKQKYKRIANSVIYVDGLRENRPVIPGSTLRGRIRRSALEAVLQLSGERIPLAQWHQNAVGGIKGSESDNGFDVALREDIRKKNPILSLFGAGSPWLASRALIDQAMPRQSVETDVVGSVRADDGRRDNELFQKVDENGLEEWLRMTGANSTRTAHKASIKEVQAELRKARKDKNTDEIARLEAVQREMQGDEATAKVMSTNPVSMPLAHEAMPKGVILDHGITLTGVTMAEIGLLFAALNSFWAQKPGIGQKVNSGYGLCEYTYELELQEAVGFNPFKIGNQQQNAFKPLGTVIGKPYFGIETAPDFVSEAMDAFCAAFESGEYDFSVIAQTTPIEKGDE